MSSPYVATSAYPEVPHPVAGEPYDGAHVGVEEPAHRWHGRQDSEEPDRINGEGPFPPPPPPPHTPSTSHVILTLPSEPYRSISNDVAHVVGEGAHEEGGGGRRPPEPGKRNWRAWIKTPEQLRWQWSIELALLRAEWPWLAAAAVVEYLHMLAHSLVYFIQGVVYGEKGPPEPAADIGAMLFADLLGPPPSMLWLTDFFIYCILTLAPLVIVARMVLNVDWGEGPRVGVEGRGGSKVVMTMPAPVMIVVKRMLQALVLLIPLRCITFLVTLMPNPVQRCHAPLWDPPKSAAQVFEHWDIGGENCGDLLYSGHTTHGLICAYMVLRYFPRPRFLGTLACVMVGGVMWSLIAFRGHYTVDVLVALYVTTMGWKLLTPEPKTLTQYGIRVDVCDTSLATTTDTHVETHSQGACACECVKGFRGVGLYLKPPPEGLRPMAGVRLEGKREREGGDACGRV